jgi:hypothetical protein
MGLKGYRLWAMGQLDSTCSAPPQPKRVVGGGGEAQPPRGVDSRAAHVARVVALAGCI